MKTGQLLLLCIATCAAQYFPYKHPGDKPGEGTRRYGNSTVFTRTVTMDANHVIVAKWDLDEENEAVIFHVYAKTLGWVGFGLSPNGGMTGSDMVIGWIDDAGNVNFTDRHAPAEDIPIVDEQQDYELLEATQNDTHTIFHFKRKLDTCDPDDWKIENVGTMRLIYAYGLEDPDPQVGPTYHETRRGTKSVHLTPVSQEVPKMPVDAGRFDLLMNKYEIQELDTQYVCQIFKVPLTSKNHAIKIEPVLESGNEDIVHHIITYNCYGNVVNGHEGYPVECASANMPDEWAQCGEVSYVWTVGATDFYLPEEAGLSYGGGAEDPTHIMLEMHYDNPTMMKGRIDSSGLRYVVTPTLRQYDVGVLQVLQRYEGPFWQVPPYFEDFRTFVGRCPSECTQEGYKDYPEGVTFFANVVHMHLYGTEILLRHFRDGVEQPLIDFDMHYDFNLQDMRHLSTKIKVLPGDELVADCKYDSSKRTTSVKTGLSTQEEMCFHFAMYYPRMPLVKCKTAIDIPFTLKHMLNITDVTIDKWTVKPEYAVVNSPPAFAGLTHDVVLAEHVDWTDPANRKMYQDIQKWGPIRAWCQNSDGSWMMADKLLAPSCIEVYRDEGTDDTCPAFPKPHIPDRCAGPNPFPDAVRILDASCIGDKCATDVSPRQEISITTMAVLMTFVTTFI